MKIATSSQMRKIDNEALELFGIPGIILMENAGIKLFKHIESCVGWKDKRIGILCGKGNNGGDGFVASRHLFNNNKNIVIYVVGDLNSLKGDAAINYNIATKMGIDIRTITCSEDIISMKEDLMACGIIVDGLLGTGIKGEVTGLYCEIIRTINDCSHNAFVISIDIPSGISADTGKIMGEAIRANKTVTFALPKIGLYTYPGAEYAGEIAVEDISIPDILLQKQYININLLEGSDIKPLFNKRKKDTNKGTYGRALIIAGSKNMMGACVMSTISALRSGAGLVELVVPRCIQDRVAPVVLEAIVKGMDDEDGIFSYSVANVIIESLKHSQSFAIGPGLSQSNGLLRLLKEIVREADIPGVIDADGLNLLSKDLTILHNVKKTIVVTPHPGEMARLAGKEIKEIQSARIEYARDFSIKYKVVTVLKGANTVVSSPNGDIFINTTGNPGMARGGAGDILTGMIVSFMAQGIEPFDAARAAVYIHGLAGDMICENIGEYGMKATDIIDYLPYAIKKVYY